MQLYERDFYAWIDYHIALLKQGKLAEIDVEILIDELESMARRDKRELMSHFIILIAHLLKWQFQPEQRSNSWRGSIREQRIQIADQLADSPSLNRFLEEAIALAYPKAIDIAASETGEKIAAHFPVICPYKCSHLLDKDFYPESAKISNFSP